MEGGCGAEILAEAEGGEPRPSSKAIDLFVEPEASAVTSLGVEVDESVSIQPQTHSSPIPRPSVDGTAPLASVESSPPPPEVDAEEEVPTQPREGSSGGDERPPLFASMHTLEGCFQQMDLPLPSCDSSVHCEHLIEVTVP